MAQETGKQKQKEEDLEKALEEASEELHAQDAESAGEEGPTSLEAEVELLRDKVMRAQADYQNLRRRSSAEYETGIKRTLQPLLEELLFVLDYLELALASPTTTDEAKNLAVGVEMTRTKLFQALEKVEVFPIVAEGVFDPKLHDASETRVAPDAEPGTILETTRRGYTWKELVLRPAQVIVAASEEAEASEEEQADEG